MDDYTKNNRMWDRSHQHPNRPIFLDNKVFEQKKFDLLEREIP